MTVTTFLGDDSPGQRPTHATRPVVMGRRGVVTSGHYLATAAGFRIMEQGGNAIDAAAAMCFCLNLLEPQSNGLAGEVPTLIYSARERRAYALSGMGWSAQAFTIDWCREHGIDLIPGDGYLPACVPAVVGTWTAALARFGTLSFAEVAQPAIELAEHGFPVYPGLRDSLAGNEAKYTELYPSTGEVYLPSGQAPEVGDLLRNPAWAETLRILCRAERAAAGRGRVAGIEAARDAFYKGEIAERIIDFITANPVEDASGSAHAGLLTYDDFAEWEADFEEPVSFNYHGLEVSKCSSWTQGPVFVQQLSLLQGFDLAAMGHNSADYLHTVIECAKLAFADREAHYGDPRTSTTCRSTVCYPRTTPLNAARWSASARPWRCGPVISGTACRRTPPSTWPRTTARPCSSRPAKSGTLASATRTWATPPTWTPWTPRATWSRPPPAADGWAPRR